MSSEPEPEPFGPNSELKFGFGACLIMTLSSHLKNHHISILYFWNKGIRSVRDIHHKTNISLSTIYYNIHKWKQTNLLKHRGGNGQPCVLRRREKKSYWSRYSTKS